MFVRIVQWVRKCLTHRFGRGWSARAGRDRQSTATPAPPPGKRCLPVRTLRQPRPAPRRRPGDRCRSRAGPSLRPPRTGCCRRARARCNRPAAAPGRYRCPPGRRRPAPSPVADQAAPAPRQPCGRRRQPVRPGPAAARLRCGSSTRPGDRPRARPPVLPARRSRVRAARHRRCRGWPAALRRGSFQANRRSATCRRDRTHRPRSRRVPPVRQAAG